MGFLEKTENTGGRKSPKKLPKDSLNTCSASEGSGSGVVRLVEWLDDRPPAGRDSAQSLSGAGIGWR